MFTQYFNASGANLNVQGIGATERGRSILRLEVRGVGWTGTLKVAGRALGRGQDGTADYAGYLSIRNLLTPADIAGAAGITAAGLYEIDITGYEVQLEHAWTAGSVSVWGTVLSVD